MAQTTRDEQEQREARRRQQAKRAPAQGRPADSPGEQIEQVVAGGQEMMHEAARQVARERRPRWRILRYGRLWLLGYAIMLAAVVALALAAHAFSVLPGDLPFTRELQETRNPLVFWTLYIVSYIGFPTQSTIIFLLAFVALWVVGSRLEAVFLVPSLLADLLVGVLKTVVGRHRPSPGLVNVVSQLGSPSFPSGHTVHYVVFYGFLAFVLVTNFRPSWGRNLLIALFLALIVLVGPSRVYLGEHWPTDVIGGYLIGALFLLPLIAGYLWVKEHYDVLPRWPLVRRRASAHAR